MSTNEKEAAMKLWAEQMLERADSEGFVELSDGVWLNSQENIIAEQDGWPEEDSAKAMDFTTDPYWITTNDGQMEAVDGAEDIPAQYWVTRDQGETTKENTMKSLLEINEHTTAEEIRAAVAAGADVNERVPYYSEDNVDLDGERVPCRDAGMTPLHYARNAEQTKVLIAAGADVNARSDDIPDQEPSNTEWRYWREENAPQVVGRDAAGEDVYEYPNLPEPSTRPGHAGKVPLEKARDAEQAKALLDAGAKVPDNLDEWTRGYVEQAQAELASEREQGNAPERESFVLSDRAREMVRPKSAPAKAPPSYEMVKAVYGRDMSPDAMHERATEWYKTDEAYQKAMEPSALRDTAKAQEEWEREHTHSNPFGGEAIKEDPLEESPADKLRALRQAHEDGLAVLREDAGFLNAVVKGHEDYKLVQGLLTERGNIIENEERVERMDASRNRDPEVKDLLDNTAPERHERSSEALRDQVDEKVTAEVENGKRSLAKSLGAATGK